MQLLGDHPPKPITKTSKQTPVKESKTKKAKNKTKGNSKKSPFSTPAKSATFKRNVKSNKVKLSPLVKAVRAKRAKANGASAPAVASAPAAPVDALEDLRTRMKNLGVPDELLPDKVPKGSKSYTKNHATHAGSIQVLHGRGLYYVNTNSDGIVPKVQTYSWTINGGPDIAWSFIRKYIQW